MPGGPADTLLFSWRDTLVRWTAAIEPILYDLARRNGHSPLDRGRDLRRRFEALLQELGGEQRSFATAYELLAEQSGYRWRDAGSAALATVLCTCRPHPDVAPALELAARAGFRLVVASDEDPELVDVALRPLDGAFAAVFTGRDVGGRGSAGPVDQALARLDIPAWRIVHVAASQRQLNSAGAPGVCRAWLDRRLPATTETARPAPAAAENGRPAPATAEAARPAPAGETGARPPGTPHGDRPVRRQYDWRGGSLLELVEWLGRRRAVETARL
ncbi:haloacid dehalogenase%2C type II [Mycobacterium tuberculosis]|nr:haloacid dehalogenase%2C type II [Mycobacterium tuberculosis]